MDINKSTYVLNDKKGFLKMETCINIWNNKKEKSIKTNKNV